MAKQNILTIDRCGSCPTFPGGLVEPPVDGCDFFDPAASLGMLHVEQEISRPVEVVGKIGYLLVESFEGVACNPPRLAMSTSISAEHSGQVNGTADVPRSFTWR
jgi:hypothetical protein